MTQSTVELTLLMEVWVSQPKNVRMGDLFLPLICHMVARARERCHPHTPGAGERADPESRRALPVPPQLQYLGECLGSTALRMGNRRTGPTHCSLFLG